MLLQNCEGEKEEIGIILRTMPAMFLLSKLVTNVIDAVETLTEFYIRPQIHVIRLHFNGDLFHYLR